MQPCESLKLGWAKGSTSSIVFASLLTHLANTIELVLPLAHPSPQTKWQISRFSYFCTAHGRVSSSMPEHVLSHNNCYFACGIWAQSNTCFFGPTRVHNSSGISISSAVFCTDHGRVSLCFTMGCPFPLKLHFSAFRLSQR